MKADINILILEDNQDDFFLLKETIESSEEINSKIIHADRLEKSIQTAENQTIDIAVIDLNIPDSFGLETFESFHDRFPHIPTVIMTGVNDFETAISAVQKGAQDYLEKGEVSSSEIIRTLRYALERHELIANLERTKDELQRSLDESRFRENNVNGLLKVARVVLEQTDFDTTARQVFDTCSELIGSTSGYVALLSEDGEENEVLFLEAGGLPCTVDPELPMPIRGLRETAYRTNSTVYDNDFMNSEWVQFMPKGHVPLENVMFAPLVIKRKTVGIIGLANKKNGFTDDDARIASGFGELAAVALQNSRNLDKRDKAEKNNTRLIEELRDALANVKKLSGLLPICSHCKKIRDDQGYWKQIELYIHENSEAKFSHGICQECAKTHYPDLDIYDE
jgi:DNA-binding NarL/FixJ family response regulator